MSSKCGWSLQDMPHAVWLTNDYRGQNPEEMKQEPIQGGLKLFMCYLFFFFNICLNKICFLRKCCCDMIAQPTVMWFPIAHTITGFASFVQQLPLTTHHFPGSYFNSSVHGLLWKPPYYYSVISLHPWPLHTNTPTHNNWWNLGRHLTWAEPLSPSTGI